MSPFSVYVCEMDAVVPRKLLETPSLTPLLHNTKDIVDRLLIYQFTAGVRTQHTAVYREVIVQ